MDGHKITVAVCGDSFCAASNQDLQVTGTGRRAHFSQMLEDKYGYEVLHLAHGGFSNLAVYYQIKQALALSVNVIVYTSTWTDRLEIYRDYSDPANKDFNFCSEANLKNFFYYNPHHESSNTPYVGGNLAAIISSSVNNIEGSPYFSISPEQKKAIDLYFKYLYHDGVATEVDQWMFEYWHNKIEQAGALPIFFKRPEIGQIAYDFSINNPNFDTPFHTDRHTQEQIATNIHQYICNNLRAGID